MFISKKIIDKWFKVYLHGFSVVKKSLFKKLKGYDQQRLYAYLAERYLSFIKKNTKYLEWHWTFLKKSNS